MLGAVAVGVLSFFSSALRRKSAYRALYAGAGNFRSIRSRRSALSRRWRVVATTGRRPLSVGERRSPLLRLDVLRVGQPEAGHFCFLRLAAKRTKRGDASFERSDIASCARPCPASETALLRNRYADCNFAALYRLCQLFLFLSAE